MHTPGDPITRSQKSQQFTRCNLTLLFPKYVGTATSESISFLSCYPCQILFVFPIVRNDGIPHLELASQGPVHAVSLSSQGCHHLFPARPQSVHPQPPAAILHYPLCKIAQSSFKIQLFLSWPSWASLALSCRRRRRRLIDGFCCACVSIFICENWKSVHQEKICKA